MKQRRSIAEFACFFVGSIAALPKIWALCWRITFTWNVTDPDIERLRRDPFFKADFAEIDAIYERYGWKRREGLKSDRPSTWRSCG